MRGNGKFYALLLLLTAGALLLFPVCLLPASGEPQPDGPAASTAGPSDTSGTAAVPASRDDTDTSVFLVLHADGTQVSAIAERDFLVYTLAAEMLPDFEEEALKAQAVASYTYFCYERDRELASPSEALHGADFADTPVAYPDGYCEEYWRKKWGDEAFDRYYPRLCAAVDAVAGERILYQGQPILAAYHAISGGVTELPEVVWSGAFPYLQSVASPGDELAPQYETTVTLTPEALREALDGVEGLSLPEDPAAWLGEAERSAAGTVLALPVGGVSLSGQEWRRRLGLRSACFTAAYADGRFTFTVQGYGHGVGMSQYGAEYLAKAGYSYREILQYYYKDVTVG